MERQHIIDAKHVGAETLTVARLPSVGLLRSRDLDAEHSADGRTELLEFILSDRKGQAPDVNRATSGVVLLQESNTVVVAIIVGATALWVVHINAVGSVMTERLMKVSK